MATQFIYTMRRILRAGIANSLGVFAVVFGVMTFSGFPASAAPTGFTNNYVVFYADGDCNKEDCISTVYEALSAIPGIVKVDCSSLASHNMTGHRTILVSFANLRNAPYTQVMQAIASEGYNVVSYVIHDIHKPHQDLIIPH